MKDGRTEMGKGVTKKGLEIYWNIYEVILRERHESKKFDDDFLKSKLHELEGGKKVVKKKRKVVQSDEYIDVHRKLMRAMAEEEGSDLEKWMKV